MSRNPRLPMALEAERECLSAVNVDNASLDVLRTAGVRPEDFGIEIHRRVYAAMLSLRDEGVPIDAVTLRQRLVDQGEWEKVGARGISESFQHSGVSWNVEYYAKTVRAKAAIRALITTAREIETAALGDGEDPTEHLDKALGKVRDVAEQFRPTDAFTLTNWAATDKFVGKAPEVSWIVPDVIARGEAHLLAAPGDSGKGFMTLSMCLQLASGHYLAGRKAPFGNAILPSTKPCTCVLFYAEDSQDAVHRRLESIDPGGLMRCRAGARFICIPMPSAGGAFSVLEKEPGGTFRTTERWRDVVEQLKRLPDLGFVLLDPLSCFLSLDVDKDSAAAQAFCGEQARVAAELNCALMFSHHMRKASGDTKGPQELPTHETVRESIRGVAALLNGVRMAYGFVPLPAKYAKGVLAALNEHGEVDVGRVFWGAVVKANGRTDRRPHIYVRSHAGLLENRTSELLGARDRIEDVLKELAQ